MGNGPLVSVGEIVQSPPPEAAGSVASSSFEQDEITVGKAIIEPNPQRLFVKKCFLFKALIFYVDVSF